MDSVKPKAAAYIHTFVQQTVLSLLNKSLAAALGVTKIITTIAINFVTLSTALDVQHTHLRQ
jgi:uncharacterized membrane protein required for colicin V production